MQEENLFELRAMIAMLKHISDAPDHIIVPDTDLALVFVFRELEKILEEEEKSQNEYELQIEDLKASICAMNEQLKIKH